MQELGIESSLVEDIRQHKKCVEARLGKPRFLRMREGDILSIREDLYLNGEVIDSFKDSLQVKITQVLHFETFSEMLDAIDYQAAVPSAKSKKQALDKYREFYSTEDEIEYGVVAMFFETI
jgi:ASC-1-like (ASCH) protein